MDSKKKKSPRSSENGDFINILDSAFGEKASEKRDNSEVAEGGQAAAPSRRKGNAFHFVLGLFVIALSVIGLASSVSFISGKVRNIIDNTEQKTEFVRFIYPVVICDPPPFDQPSRLKNETLVSAAAWDIILYEDKSKYTADFDYIIVPELDIEQHAAKLFGSGLSITHTTISNADISFYYDEEISSYRIPANPKFFTYSPYIEEISKVGESYTLTVGYISPAPAWLTLTSDETPQPDKYVEYVVQKRGSTYTLSSVRQSDRVTDSERNSGF